eukprot:TRINITY_DN2740_c0_g1_i1.p1 TRINITY_DN2740_c0_g1~~TRINITY_DN2740_c0_g1_i1.p1  ORF type:complete len:481 (-),score=75.65 TRINITY_DN2740_c0_g1_i1:218-1660(-)
MACLHQTQRLPAQREIFSTNIPVQTAQWRYTSSNRTGSQLSFNIFPSYNSSCFTSQRLQIPKDSSLISLKGRKFQAYALSSEQQESFNVPQWTIGGKRPWESTNARLVLQDGSVWKAKSFGAEGTQVGEVVFNTSLTGYQEILTDPSYAGQFVLMTNPHIGNTGVNFDDEESRECFLAGLLIRNLSICVSNWRARESLPEYLKKKNIMGIYDIDTRAITRRLREDGSLIGVLSTDASMSDNDLLEMARSWNIVGKDLVSGVTCKEPYEWSDTTGAEWDFNTCTKRSEKYHVVAYDFGIKHNILRRLASHGCKITVVPSAWPASKVLELNPDGILFSNGPGDPSAIPYAVQNVKEVVGKVPVFGICMGHQLLGQALGGKTFKLKFGHHGGNHPVRNLRNGHVEISAQNHNYAVDPASLPEGIEITHVNLNDGTCAGLSFPALKAMSLQYHPEASPGPHDSDSIFREFINMIQENKKQQYIS